MFNLRRLYGSEQQPVYGGDQPSADVRARPHVAAPAAPACGSPAAVVATRAKRVSVEVSSRESRQALMPTHAGTLHRVARSAAPATTP